MVLEEGDYGSNQGRRGMVVIGAICHPLDSSEKVFRIFQIELILESSKKVFGTFSVCYIIYIPMLFFAMGLQIYIGTLAVVQ